MPRKRKTPSSQPASTRSYAFVICDAHTRNRINVAGPVLFMLVRRAWANHVGIQRRRENGQLIEEHVARLIDHFALRSAVLTPEGNLSLAALLEKPSQSIRSWWPGFEEKIMQAEFGCALSFDHAIALAERRQNAIIEECSGWGLPEQQAIVTGVYLQPEEACAAIVR